MSTYLDLLPEELNEIIYKEVFKETLQELVKTSLCCSCDCIIYDCNDKLKPTIFGWFSKPFKPPRYSEEYDELPVKYKKIIRTIDILLLLFIVGMFVYPFYVK